MIKFSWKKLNDTLNWSIQAVVKHFYTKLPLPAGDCYILNIEELLQKEANVSSNYDIYLYIELASKRSLFDYKMRGVKHLKLALVEPHLIPMIEESSILNIENDNVHFKYE